MSFLSHVGSLLPAHHFKERPGTAQLDRHRIALSAAFAHDIGQSPTDRRGICPIVSRSPAVRFSTVKTKDTERTITMRAKFAPVLIGVVGSGYRSSPLLRAEPVG